jgi:hypothetical protein
MKEVTDSNGNVFIYIPKFYVKYTKNANGTYKHQISGCRYDGFVTLFCDGKGNEIDYVLVGKYEGSGSASKIYSKSGQTVLVNITLPNFRKGCVANGAGYQQYDFLIDAIIKELFLVEFATTNSQSIMRGYTASTNTAALITGHTDNVKTASGSWNTNHDSDTDAWTDTSCNTDGIHACKYRGIENPWGNTWTWCDGINFKKEKVFVCESPTDYASDKYDAPYTYMGDRSIAEGYITKITPFAKNPALGYITGVGGSESTYYCDYSWTNSGNGTVLRCGGYWVTGSDAGLWSWSGSYGSSGSSGGIGGRLCYKPL